MELADVDFETALGLLSLPRDVGIDPETGEMIEAGIGRFGRTSNVVARTCRLKGEDERAH